MARICQQFVRFLQASCQAKPLHPFYHEWWKSIILADGRQNMGNLLDIAYCLRRNEHYSCCPASPPSRSAGHLGHRPGKSHPWVDALATLMHKWYIVRALRVPTMVEVERAASLFKGR